MTDVVIPTPPAQASIKNGKDFRLFKTKKEIWSVGASFPDWHVMQREYLSNLAFGKFLVKSGWVQCQRLYQLRLLRRTRICHQGKPKTFAKQKIEAEGLCQELGSQSRWVRGVRDWGRGMIGILALSNIWKGVRSCHLFAFLV